MKNLLLLSLPALALATAVLSGRLPAPDEPAPGAARVPVVVELFTSEGCSSCPAADAVLLELEKTQPLAGVEVIALSEHVDYWNRLGWRDPFSAPQFTERQRQYAAVLQSNTYTPQAVVAGQHELVGSQRAQLTQAITAAAQVPRAEVTLTAAEAGGTATSLPLRVSVKQATTANGAEVLLAITEKGLSTNVGRGENSGRLLRHPAVVRELRSLGTVGADGTFAAAPTVAINRQWKPENVRLVVLVQERQRRRIVGAATLPLR